MKNIFNGGMKKMGRVKDMLHDLQAPVDKETEENWKTKISTKT